MKRIGLTFAALTTVIFLAYLADRGTRLSLAQGEKRTPPNAASNTADFTLKDLDGREQSLGQFKGKVVLVNFWATWCGPCRIEISWLVDLQEKYQNEGFTVLGVAMDEEGKSAVAPFVQRERFKIGNQSLPMNYPILIGDDVAADRFGGLLGVPTTILISRDGRQVKRVDGQFDYDEMDKTIQSLLQTNERLSR
jgi:thiol-disulfide isomerase/thioredoxin